MVTCSHYRKADTRRIKPPPAQSDDADILRMFHCLHNCSPESVKWEVEGGRGETNTEITPSLPPCIGAAAVPDIGGYRQSIGAPRVMGFPISPAVSPYWSGRFLSDCSTLRNRCVTLYSNNITQRKLQTSLTVLL